MTLTATGTATGGGTDYTLASNTITINAGSTTGTTTVTAVQDLLDEPNETVILDITGVTNGTENGTQQETITITDDDAAPTVSLSVSPATIAEAAGVSTVTATLSAASQNWTQVGSDIDGEASDDLSGTSLSLSSDGTILAIGAGFNDGNGLSSGHVRVYHWNGSAWVQRGVDIDGETAGDQSGVSVSLSSDGTILAIGARFNDGN